MRTVPLYGRKASGRVVLVDDEDYGFVMQYRWNISEPPGSATPYAMTNLPMARPHRTAQMHCLLTGYPLTDHRDRNGLNNQRANLRIATPGQNLQNQRSRGGASVSTGVSRAASRGRWVAFIRKNGHRRTLGTFGDEISAALAYDAAARQLHGAYARVNFPNREAGEAGALDYLEETASAPADTQGAGAYVPDRPGTST